jgi:hypothetical protein
MTKSPASDKFERIKRAMAKLSADVKAMISRQNKKKAASQSGKARPKSRKSP